MAHVLAMTALQLCDPIAILILMEADNPVEHESTRLQG